MMKKAMALVLSLALAASTFVAGAAFSDVPADHKNAEAINLLSEMKVLQGKEGDNYDPTGTLTRAEACAIVYRITTGQVNTPTAPTTNTGFSDVSDQHWAGKYIQYCAGLGVVDGYPGDTFKPDQAVTYAEFVTMMVRALGVNTDGYKFPDSYMSTAGAQGMTQDVTLNNDDPAARADVAEVVYNTMFEADYVRAGRVDGNYKTIASQVFRMERSAATKVGAQGEVTYSITGGTQSGKATADKALIGQEAYVYETKDAQGDITGKNVVATSNNKVFGTYKAAELEADDTIKVDGKKLTANSATFYYNGNAADGSVTSIKKENMPVTYTVISNDGKTENYESVLVNETLYGEVASVSADGKVMTISTNSQTLTVDLTSSKVSVYAGAKKGDKVAVVDNKATKRIASSASTDDAVITKLEKQTGAVSSVSDGVYTINGKQYRMATGADTAFANGATCDFYAIDGIIMESTKVTAATNYAYVLNSTTINNGDPAVRVLMPNGEIKVYATTKDASGATADTAEGLVSYQLNNEGKIYTKAVTGTALNASQTISYDAEVMQLNNNGTKVYLTADTVVYVKDKDGNVEVVKATDLGNFSNSDLNSTNSKYELSTETGKTNQVKALYLNVTGEDAPAKNEKTEGQNILVTSEPTTTYETTYKNGFEEKVEYVSFKAYVNGAETECKMAKSKVTGTIAKDKIYEAEVTEAGVVKSVTASSNKNSELNTALSSNASKILSIQGGYALMADDSTKVYLADNCKVVDIVLKNDDTDGTKIASVAAGSSLAKDDIIVVAATPDGTTTTSATNKATVVYRVTK